jgi:REP element-mobilizing transposase RayT
MGLARKSYVNDDEIGVYHCFTRCVRRAFLCGFDPVTQRDYSHRKAWIVDRLHLLAGIFAIDVCAYAVMENHDHTILRTRPDVAAAWSDREVAIRWLTLFPCYCRKKETVPPPTENQISALADNMERIAQLRKRLSSLSWFMGRLNECIARAANKEDRVRGRFWESRFKCVRLLDDAAIVACMVYVDLNPVRAGRATTPEESDFTSIQERIRAWHKEMPVQDPLSGSDMQSTGICTAASERVSNDAPTLSATWLCPIQSNSTGYGILQMTEAEYFDLVDRSGRMLRSGKRGVIDADLAPILLRIGVKPEAWMDTISSFESRFRLAAGLLSSLRSFADRIGRCRLVGVSAARFAFASSPAGVA